MRKNLNKLARIVFALSIVLLLANCDRNEPLGQDNTTPIIANAKSSFEDYKSNVTFDPMFQNLEYHWEKASLKILDDNSQVIMLPADYADESSEYKGQKILHLYNTKDSNQYNIALFETIPYKNQLINYKELINLNIFNGYIMQWNLEYGFVQGAEYKNGLPILDLDVKTQNNKIRNASTSKINESEPILLNEVVVKGNSVSAGTTLAALTYFRGYNNAFPLAFENAKFHLQNIGFFQNPAKFGFGGIYNNAAYAKELLEILRKRRELALTLEHRIDITKLEPCPKEVMEKLKNATLCDIAYILEKLNVTKVYNVNIETAETTNGDIGQTDRISKNNYNIKITPNYSNGTKLFKASVLLHEITHAYFLSIVDDYKGSNPPNSAAFTDLPTLFQAYVNKSYPGTQQDAHHEQMANTYVNAIADALKEYDGNIYAQKQVYTDLAWGGLQKTPIFEKLFPEGNPNRDRILDRLRCESAGRSVNEGTSKEQKPIGKPCN
jgi:hypothetical protein